MYCWSAPGAVAVLAARQALALCVLAVLAAAVVASGSLCIRVLKCWPHTLLVSCLSVLAQAVQQVHP